MYHTDTTCITPEAPERGPGGKKIRRKLLKPSMFIILFSRGRELRQIPRINYEGHISYLKMGKLMGRY